MEFKEEILKESSTHKLTKLWLGLFFFALVINVIPYLPFVSSGSDEIQVVMQTNHSAICSSIAYREATPRSNSSLLEAGPSGSLPSSFRVQKAQCSLPTLALATNNLPSPILLGTGFFVVHAKVFSAAHPSRGPPRA